MCLLLFFLPLIFGCHPQCRYVCDDPVCQADCRIFCKDPECIYECPGFGVACQDNPPRCRNRCNTSADACESDSCPMCETICEPPDCNVPGHFCGIVCAPTECAWKCFLPTNCPPPTCQLMCEHPACELPANQSYKLYAGAPDLWPGMGLLLALLFLFTQIQ